jgi:hypothetical protein
MWVFLKWGCFSGAEWDVFVVVVFGGWCGGLGITTSINRCGMVVLLKT